MTRAYSLKNNHLVPVEFEPTKKSVYISEELFIALHKATGPELKQAQKEFSQAVNSDDFQIICLVGTIADQSISSFEIRETVMNVPVARVYKVD